jgi:pyruvate/2-oxoglutarate dehydrogenase complex dihydrolipoamide acyltransferase (E2) component
MALPLLAKAAAVLVPVGFGLVLLSTKKAKAKAKAEAGGKQTQETLNLDSQVIRAAQLGLADELDRLAPQFGAGGAEAGFAGGIANRIRSRTTGTGFGDPAQGKIFDPGGDLAQGGQFKGGPASIPLREFQGLLLTFLGDTAKLVGWSQAMGAMGFVNYATQLRDKALGKASGGGGALQPTSPAGDLGARVAAVLSSQDPTRILVLADELAAQNLEPALVEQLRTIARDLQAAKAAADEARRKAEEAAKPTPGTPTQPSTPPFVPPAPGPSDVVVPPFVPPPGPAPAPAPPANVARRIVVQPGESPRQLAKLITGNENRFRELVAANVPPKTRDKTTGGFKFLNPGEQLIVPPSWPTHPRAVPLGAAAPAPAPTPGPAVPTPASPGAATNRVRRAKVLPGEGPIKVATRLFFGDGAQANIRWKELVAANVPPKKRDAKTGNFTILNPGELLVIPPSWDVDPTQIVSVA